MKDRIVDANLNRLSEGLRVIEDAARFGLDDAAIAARLKAFRHAVGQLRAQLPLDLLSARDSRRDVGREKVPERAARADTPAILDASFGRVAESLRVIEEWSKLAHPAAARRAKAMRYESYELHKVVATRFDRAQTSARLRGLYLVMTNPEAGYERLTEIAVREGVAAVQLRDKRLDGRALLALARRLRAITRGSATMFIVNDRPDVARLAEADGVHVGQGDLSIADARAIVGERMLVGKSTHNLAQLARALAERPDYVAIGPLFATGSKAVPDPVLGIAKARRMLARARPSGIPAVAIGGIDAQRLPAVLNAGFKTYSLISCVGASRDPRGELRKLKAIGRSLLPRTKD